MSLRIFHLIFITVCLALCVFMVRWGYLQRTTQGWVLAGVFFAGAVALLIYSKKILRKFRELP